jgi:hypothetical protein
MHQSYRSVIVAPSFQVYLPQLWEGASIMTILSFLNIMKENFISEAKKEGDLIDPKCLSQFDKISSGGLLALGILGIAEVGGLSLQSLLTLSGAGGMHVPSIRTCFCRQYNNKCVTPFDE